MNKVQATKLLLSLGGSQGIIVPSVSTGDSGIKTITLEGSASMYDPIRVMSQVLKASGQTLEVNILPLGSSMGKESYSSKSIDFILASIDERKSENTNPYSLESEITETKEGGYRQVYFAQDPLVFVFKKDPKCTQEITYKPYDLDQYLEKGDSDGKGDWKGNRGDLIKLFTTGQGNFSECNYGAFIREGGELRSNLNKAFLATPEKGISEGLLDDCYLKKTIQEANCNKLVSEDNLTKCPNIADYYCWPKSTSSLTSFRGSQLPENNWLALERFKRSAPLGSSIFFPRSFFDANPSLFAASDLTVVHAQDPVTEDDKAQDDPSSSDGSAMNIGTPKKNVFKRKYYLQFQVSDQSSNTENQAWIKKLLLDNQFLYSSLDLLTPRYYDKSQQQVSSDSDQSSNQNSQNKKTIEITKNR
ncbi:hypothetical protein [Candidatus Mycoplasma haematominutum]|uniref:PBP domain-containing protein n=1 Tax=Candidatus Mycoplasma haematominutum 'Birmingham 1' TaxID=1116213 RepID=G8C2U3_9MOLU|nr:hypothetical protein [Candidatus Mycoplasma haematominutum]CCE66641.1 hypothetical protein (homolog to MSU_0380) [Candidatus Mycoplasma haematominutum 'Birmingham 1']